MTEDTTINVTAARGVSDQADDNLFLTFFGRNGDVFRKTLHKMREKDPALKRMVFSWCWPAFLIAPVWLFYRKMYAWAVGIVAFPTALELLTGSSGIAGDAALYAILAMQAKSLYVHHANSQLKRLRKHCTSEAELMERAQKSGGVSILSAVIGTALIIGGLLVVYHFAP
jgi:hypothetical protein